MVPKKLVPRAGLPLALAAAFSSPAFAQRTPTLQEVQVRATRFAEPEASLPLGVSVVTADEIRASGAASVGEALVRLLGLPGRQDLNNGGDFNIDLRGFGATADANQVVVVDGIRLTESDLSSPRVAGIPIESIERIEVLRGSGAVLYGEGATGGVIVITTKAGAGRRQANGATLYGAAGSHALRDLRASGTVSTANGFSLDAHAQKRETKGFRANSASDTEAGSVTGQWSNDWLRLGARAMHDDLDARLPGSLSAAQYAADPRQTNTPNDFGSIRQDVASVFASAELGAWQLALDAGQREKKVRSNFSGFPFAFDVDAHTYALRARHEGKLGGAGNILVLGVDRNTWERTSVTNASDADQTATALYVKDDVILAGGTRLSAGARTEKIDKESSGTTLADRQHAWEFGASHPMAAGWTVYARVGHSYRLANADEFTFTSTTPLRPQVSRDTEIGARWKHAADKLDARLYRSTLTDEIGFDPNAVNSFGFTGANINLDPTLREGLELDWSHAVTARLGLRANAIVRKASFRSGPNAGKDVPLVPRKALALRADWTPVAGHRLNAGVNWVSSQHPDFANACRMPSYTTADARYAWQFRPNAEVALGVTNLFDRKFFSQAFTCSAGVTGGIFPDPGRQVTASLRVQF